MANERIQMSDPTVRLKLLQFLDGYLNGTLGTNVTVTNTPLPTTDTNSAAMLLQLQTIAGDTTAIEALQTSTNALITTMNGYVNDVEALLAAIETNGNDLETLLTAVGLNTVDIENLLTTLNTNTGATTDAAVIAGANGSIIAILKGLLNSISASTTDIAALEVLLTAIEVDTTSIDGKLTTIDTKLQTLLNQTNSKMFRIKGAADYHAVITYKDVLNSDFRIDFITHTGTTALGVETIKETLSYSGTTDNVTDIQYGL